jgi:thiol-disulfide isomerase/thioredoxin
LNLLHRLTAFIITLIVISSCNDVPRIDKTPALLPGEYTIQFHVGETDIPVRLTVHTSNQWSIHNWTERIMLDSVVFNGNQFHITMPLFNTALDGTIQTDTTFSGTWTDHSRDSLYTVPFSAKILRTGITKSTNPHVDTLIYEAVFSPDSEDDRSNAIGKFFLQDQHVVGTFMTESGDYRFLEGTHTGESIQLSTFDGTHLFYFCANVHNDQLSDGHFYSGNHWQEEWFGKLNSRAKLRNPDSLTFVKEEKIPFAFSVKNTTGDTVMFDSTDFAGKITIVQLFGSWCPNCTDESVFLKDLYKKYHSSGLEIVPIAFERSDEFAPAMAFVKEQFSQLELEYDPYFGGKKGTASEVFPMLSKILSYPTLLIVDQHGQIRKIHTGFYGPGTGDDYVRNCGELTHFVESLITGATSEK